MPIRAATGEGGATAHLAWLKTVVSAAIRISAASISSCAMAPTVPCSAITSGLRKAGSSGRED